MTVPPSTADRFAIIPVTHGPAPADAIVVGSMKEVMEYIPQSVARNDAHEELERARSTADQIASMQNKTRAVQATMLADSVNHLSARLDTFLARRDEEAKRARRDAEEAEEKRIEDELAQLPDPDNPDTHGHLPGGELHSVPAKDEEEQEVEDQVEFALPEDLEPEPEPKGGVYPQPTSIQLNEE
jgi:hypothetical protein